MSIASTRREQFSVSINGLAGSATDTTSVVLPIATASQPVHAGDAAASRVKWTAIWSDGHSSSGETAVDVDGTGPTSKSATVFIVGASNFPSNDMSVTVSGFNGSGDLAMSFANDGSGNRSCDVLVEVDTLYVDA